MALTPEFVAEEREELEGDDGSPAGSTRKHDEEEADGNFAILEWDWSGTTRPPDGVQ